MQIINICDRFNEIIGRNKSVSFDEPLKVIINSQCFNVTMIERADNWKYWQKEIKAYHEGGVRLITTFTQGFFGDDCEIIGTYIGQPNIPENSTSEFQLSLYEALTILDMRELAPNVPMYILTRTSDDPTPMIRRIQAIQKTDKCFVVVANNRTLYIQPNTPGYVSRLENTLVELKKNISQKVVRMAIKKAREES